MPHRYPVLVDHPGETFAFRRWFQQAAALCLVYRVIGTVAAAAGFVGASDQLVKRPGVIVAMTTLVFVYISITLILCYRFAAVRAVVRGHQVRFGLGRGSWLDYRDFYVFDLVFAIALNLAFALALKPGTALDPYTEVFSIALITTVVLWTARRGGRIGAVVVAVCIAVELAVVVVNRIPIDDISWGVIATRAFWLVSGWIVALGVVRILLDNADRVERMGAEDEVLRRLSRTHDHYKEALQAIVRVSDSGSDGETIREIAESSLTLADEDRWGQKPGTIRDIVMAAVDRGYDATSEPIEFFVVDGVHTDVMMRDPEPLAIALANLCTNAARHSHGSMVTVRWSVESEYLVVTVRDDGVGLLDARFGDGLALASHSVGKLGGELRPELVRRGTKWIIRLPANVYEMAS